MSVVWYRITKQHLHVVSMVTYQHSTEVSCLGVLVIPETPINRMTVHDVIFLVILLDLVSVL